MLLHPVAPQVIGTEQATKDRKALDAIARTLGEEQEWDSEDVEIVADLVAISDRPHPGSPSLSDEEIDAITFEWSPAAERGRHTPCVGGRS